MKEVIRGEGIRAPKTKVSTAIETKDMIFISGQSGRDHKTLILPEGIEAQTKQALRNLEIILEAAGRTIEDLIYVTVYLKDLKDYDGLNKAWDEFFENVEIPPTRATVQISGLAAEGMVVEIRGIAVKS